jgi:hypothetical protein
MILFLLFFSRHIVATSNQTVKYIGNYSVQSQDNRDFLETATLVLSRSPADYSFKTESYYASTLSMSFHNRNSKSNSLSLSGIAASDSSTFFYYTVSPELRDILNLFKILDDIITRGNITAPIQAMELCSGLESYFESHSFSNGGMISLNAVTLSSTTDFHPSYFLKDIKIQGWFVSFGAIGLTAIDIYGFEFAEDIFVVEGRILGVLIAISICLSFIGWYSIMYSFDSPTKLTKLSLHSFVIHISFDLSFAFFILDLSELNPRFSMFYTLLFLFMMAIFFVLESKEISKVWKASLGDIGDLQNYQLRQLFMNFFNEIMICLFIFVGATYLVFDFPIACLPILYSFFLPQIVHSIRSPLRKTEDVWFVILITVSREIPILYFTVYRQNLFGTECPLAAILSSVYLIFQVFIVLLQNRFGGAFFLPKRLRPVILFDYRVVAPEGGVECTVCFEWIEEGENAMVTPCGHFFHQECLTRWMNEHMICPFCRHPLPGIEETE